MFPLKFALRSILFVLHLKFHFCSSSVKFILVFNRYSCISNSSYFVRVLLTYSDTLLSFLSMSSIKACSLICLDTIFFNLYFEISAISLKIISNWISAMSSKTWLIQSLRVGDLAGARKNCRTEISLADVVKTWVF